MNAQLTQLIEFIPNKCIFEYVHGILSSREKNDTIQFNLLHVIIIIMGFCSTMIA